MDENDFRGKLEFDKRWGNVDLDYMFRFSPMSKRVLANVVPFVQYEEHCVTFS